MPKVVASLLLLASLGLAACGGATATPAPTASAVPAATSAPPEPTAVPGSSSAAAAEGVLVVYETRGGECPNGPCGMKAVINGDGSVQTTDGMGGQVDARTLERLVAGIETADWAQLLAVPFTGECPVNFDGQEEIYTFTVEGQAVTVASCTIQVDPAVEPFATVREILFGPGG